MSGRTTIVRKTIVILAVGAAVGILLRWLRDRDAAASRIDPPVWPPIHSVDPKPSTPSTTRSTTSTSTPSSAGGPAWRPTLANGATPDGHPVKVKESSGIYHVPGGRFYDRTNADRCYPTAAAAEADGYRPSKA